MKKAEFVASVAQKTSLSKKDVEIALNGILDTIGDALKDGDSVNFIGFGSFSTSVRSAREAKVPGTDKVVQIPETKVVKFKAGKNLKDSLN
jgi:DNA-binding protein HU-beta